MSSQFSNSRPKPAGTIAQFQRLAGQPQRSESSSLDARQPAGKLGKTMNTRVDALRAGLTGKRGVPWTLLVIVAVLLVVGFGVGLSLWPMHKTDEARVTSSSTRQSDARPRAEASHEHGHVHEHESSQDVPAGNWQELLMRGDRQARAGQWSNAAADFAAALRVHPNDHWHWFRAATLWAWLNDRSAYRQHCDEMLRRFGETTEAHIAERTSKASLLLPGAVADITSAVRLSDQAVMATDHQFHRYFLMARGLAHYRAGEFDKALDRAGRSITPEPAHFGLAVPAILVTAMSHHRLGQTDEGRKALGQAREIMERKEFPTVESGDVGNAWHDWLICQILRREAEDLIEGGKAQ
jgi:Flp pilus assembly protein TadD